MSAIRILTVRQPWAEAIIFGGKDVENRSRNITGGFRGTIAIHSAARLATPAEWNAFSDTYPDAMGRMAETVPWGQDEYGVILGVVNLRATHHAEYCEEADEDGRACSPWAERETWHLELENPRPLKTPIPFKGALGLRWLDEDLSDSLLKAVSS